MASTVCGGICEDISSYAAVGIDGEDTRVVIQGTRVGSGGGEEVFVTVGEGDGV